MTAAQDTFWLTHYTYNTINPLVEEAQAIEPSIQLGIQAVFGHPEAAHCKQHRIEVMLHWSRDGMLAYSPWLGSKADVDRWAATVQTKIDKLRADMHVEALRKELDKPLATISSLASI